MKISIPELSLVVLIGATGSGKSTFARKHFKPTEVISSDFCRGLVSDDENDQTCTTEAFEVLRFIVGKRLQAGRLTVVDATSVQQEARKKLLELAREHHLLPVAIVFNIPENICAERNAQRPDRDFGSHVIRQHCQHLKRSLKGLEKEGFRYVSILKSPEEVDAVTIERTRLWNNLKHEHGPFDIIGDVHGCFDELEQLLTDLGYTITEDDSAELFGYAVTPPEGRKAIFVGDLVDRGPKTPQVLRLVMSMVANGSGLCVPGNHDMKLMRKLKGRDVRVTHGLAESLEQLANEPPEFIAKLVRFLDGLVSHYVLDDGKLVVAHAGLKESYQGRGSSRVRDFALFGETTGETDEYGLPVRYPWASEYRGKAIVVYGHTPVPEPEWINNTINVDTGCVFGARLTALRYPEKELVSVPARQTYYESVKPLLPAAELAPAGRDSLQAHHVLSIDDVLGKRIINTRLHRNLTVREENAIAALEVMSRFAIDPRWLIYLPPTMSPCATSTLPDLLEHPAEAFSTYRNAGVARLICEEKHMGSRACVVLCRTQEVAAKRFGIASEGIGVCYTRTGRRFFNDLSLEGEFLARLVESATDAGLWEELKTDWVLLDCELMPWSAKAQELLKDQYAAVGASALASVSPTVTALERAFARGIECGAAVEKYHERLRCAGDFVKAYRGYCWTVNSLTDLKLAPFHVLASEGAVHIDKSHLWHMEWAHKLSAAAPDLVVATNYMTVDLTDEASCDAATSWWTDLTATGGEGMVVKPLEFIAKGSRGLVQPAIKCRGREYLRIIYGPEYTMSENLERLRARGLNAKRSLALREFALGIEALERFVRSEPLYRVHECVFAVLALESEPVDPRL